MNINNEKSYKHFSFSLYLEGLKQLKLLGFISMGLVALVSILIPIGKYNDIKSYYEIAPNTKEIVTVSGSCIFLFFIFVVIVPLLTLYLFSFLTKRNACDYYHSFPNTRGCIYTSYTAAIITWIFGIIAVADILTGILYTCLSKYFVFSFATMLRFSFSIFICSLLVQAGISIACSITGNIFSNVIVTGIILFLPRLFITVLTNNITNASELFVSDKFFPLFDSRYNLVFNNSVNFLFMNQAPDMFNILSVIYTAVLAIIYFLLGYVFFRIRKSETAGNATSNRWLQGFFRICIGLAISLLPISLIFQRIAANDENNLYSIIVTYIITIIAMLLYELISTKKVKNVIKALPSIGILAILNICILGMEYALFIHQLNYSPDVHDVEYVISSFNTYSNYDKDYFQYKLKKHKFENDDIIKIITDTLKTNIEAEKKYLKSGNYSDSPANECYCITVGIKSGSFTKYRNIYINEDKYNDCMKILENDSAITDIYMNLPEYDKSNMKLSIYPDFDNYSKILNIYNTLREEVKNIDYISWHNLLYNLNSNDEEIFNCTTLNMSYVIDDNVTYTLLPISTLTPKTLMLYMELYNESNDTGKFLATFNNIDKTIKEDPGCTDFEFNILEVNSEPAIYCDFFGIIINNSQELTNAYNNVIQDIKSNINMNIDTLNKSGYSLVRLCMQDYTDSARNVTGYTRFCYVKTEHLKALYALLNDNK